MKKVLIASAVIATTALLVLGYYAISPIFRVIEVNDASPIVENTEEEMGQATTTELRSASRGPFLVTGTTGHPASGSVSVLETSGKTTIRYENFETLNGPDLYVYLATDLDARDFIDLGTIKGTKGNINYDVPEETDLSKYKYVLTWCRAFGVLFNYAKVE